MGGKFNSIFTLLLKEDAGAAAEARAAVDLVTKTGFTAIMCAADKGHEKCAALLVDARVRTPVNNIEYFPPNFEGLVLGCIDADFCK